MFWRLAGSAFVGIWMFNAFLMFGCEAVSFRGSSRLVTWTCGTAGMPGSLAALGILIAGGVVLWWLWSDLIREARADSRNSPSRGANSGPSPQSINLEQARTASASTLRGLARNERWTVRREVARNTSAPPDVLDRLASDNSSEVRLVVAENPKTSPGTLRTLVSDNDLRVQRAVSERLPVGDTTRSVPNPALSPGLSRKGGSAEDQGFGEEATVIEQPLQEPADEPDVDSIEDVDAVMERLERLVALRDGGHLTEVEFANMKRSILEGTRNDPSVGSG